MSTKKAGRPLEAEIVAALGTADLLGVTAKTVAARIGRHHARVSQDLALMVERGVVIKQKHGRNVVYRAAGQQPQAPCAPEFALLKPRPMTTIPVREGGVIMPTTSSTASVWLTGNPQT